MALVDIAGMPLLPIGGTSREVAVYTPSLGAASTIDAVNESVAHVGQVWWEDGGTHTIDTTGSSVIGWRTPSATFANAGTTVNIGIAPVDLTNGPPVRAAHTSDVIDFDVFRACTGGDGSIVNNSFLSTVPTSGSKTIAHGDLVAVAWQMTARGGVDVVQVAGGGMTGGTGGQMPTCTVFTTAYSITNGLPNVVLVASDGTIGFLFGAQCIDTTTSQIFNSGSAQVEYGNLIQPNFPGKVVGALINATINSDVDIVLYSDPLGTPVAERTKSIDGNAIGIVSNSRWHPVMFSSSYSFTKDQPLAAIYKPNATNLTVPYITHNAVTHTRWMSLGENAYMVSRASGAFASVNSNKNRMTIALLVSAFDNGIGGGSGSRVIGG